MVLATPKVEKINTQSVSSLFSDQKYTSVLKILSDIQRLTGYLDCFRHHSVKDKKILPKTSIFYAAILGMGYNIGIGKMANVSKGITEDALENFVNWHMSLDNINAANQCILDLLGKLSLASIYHKATTTSQLFKRLSSYSKQHPLYCAIKEFGRIIKSLFILRYIDDVELRQAVEKQLTGKHY